MRDRERHFAPEAFGAVPGDHQVTEPTGVATPSGDVDRPVRDNPLPEPATAEVAEGAGTVPTTLVTRDELEELQRKAAQLDKRRATDRARVARWRLNNPDDAKRQSKDSVAASRARKRG